MFLHKLQTLKWRRNHYCTIQQHKNSEIHKNQNKAVYTKQLFMLAHWHTLSLKTGTLMSHAYDTYFHLSPTEAVPNF